MIEGKRSRTADRGPRWAASTLVAVAIVFCAACGSSSATSSSSTTEPAVSPKTNTSGNGFASATQVEAAVLSATRTRKIPADVQPPLASLSTEGGPGTQYLPQCQTPDTFASSVNISSCTFGDPSGATTLVLTGDSRAEMWFNTLNYIATASKMKLVLLAKSGCPAADGSFIVNNNGTLTNTAWPACTAWHRFVASTIASLAPKLIVVATSVDLNLTGGKGTGLASPAATRADTASFLGSLPAGAKIAVLGGFPSPGNSGFDPTLCLSKGPSNIQACSFKLNSDESQRSAALAAAAAQQQAPFIDQAPWFCARVCPPIIAGIVAYSVDGYHITAPYTQYLTGVLWDALKPDLT